MKRMASFLLVTCIILLSALTTTEAQMQVQLQLTQPPPNQLRSTDLWKLTLINTTRNTLQISLKGTLEEAAAGIIVDGTSPQLSLPPGTKRITYDDVKKGNVNFKPGKWREAFTRTGNAPSGDYAICISVLDKSGEEIGKDCIEQRIQISSPPQLISPYDGEEIAAGTMPNFTAIINWGDGHPQGSIKIVEILGNQSPEVAMTQNKAWFFNDKLRTTMFQYPLSAPKLISGKKYAWKVSFENGSGSGVESEVSVFTIGNGAYQVEMIAVKLISPTEDNPPTSERPTFEWETKKQEESLSYSIVLKETRVKEDPENGRTILEQTGILGNTLPYPKDAPSLDSKKIYGWKVVCYQGNKLVTSTPFTLFYRKTACNDYKVNFVRNNNGFTKRKISPGTREGDTEWTIRKISPGTREGDTVEMTLRKISPGTREGDTEWTIRKISPGTREGDTVESLRKISPGTREGDTVESLRKISPGTREGDTEWTIRKISPGTREGDTVESLRKISPGTREGDTVESLRKVSPGTREGDTVESLRKISPGTREGDTVESLRKISPGTKEGDTVDIYCYNISIINNHNGLPENKPVSFRITINKGIIISAADIPKGWNRTPSKFPPGSSAIKWTNNSGDFPNGVTDFGNICFGNVTEDPINITYEWLDKNGNVICSGIIDNDPQGLGSFGGQVGGGSDTKK